MSYPCDSNKNSWATICDLYDRYGEEFVDKLSIRRNWDDSVSDYVADESKESMTRVQLLALDDARSILKEKISIFFLKLNLLDKYEFNSIKQWHIKLTIEALKKGGDCRGCDCLSDFDEFLKGPICNDNFCLERKGTFFSISKANFKCDRCKGSCCCKK